MGGIPVYCAQVDKHQRGIALDRVAAALELIHQRDTRRTQRLERDRVKILIARGRLQDFYSEGTNTIGLALRRVIDSPMSTLASAIVHEATHARFAHAGIYYSARLARRMETRCIEEEVAFVRRLPCTSEDDFHRWSAARRAQLDNPWWTRRGKVRAYADELEAEGAPPWLLRFVRMLP